MKCTLFCIASILLGIAPLFAQSDHINWPSFMARNDMVFDTLTQKWEEGAFTGNGLMGVMIYLKDSNALRLEIGRTDVTDHQPDSINELFAKCRLPIGHFVLRPVGRMLHNTARVDLWNAEIRGSIVTTAGTITWRVINFSEPNMIWLETSVKGQEKDFDWKWVPEESVSPRLTAGIQKAPAGYKANPPGQFFTAKEDAISYYRQPMLAGGDYTTAWKIDRSDGKRSFFISVGYAQTENRSLKEAMGSIRQATAQQRFLLIAKHRQWWHDYYRESFITMPDARLESFYWIQQYKLACASRSNRPMIDLMGPWFRSTPWPAYWFNLNTQLTYSPLYTANRLAIASVLPATIDRNLDHLIHNAPEPYRYNSLALGRCAALGMNAPITVTTDTACRKMPPADLELGNATWLLYYYWMQYRYTMDKKLLTSLFPLLKRSVNYYLHLLQKEEDGKYHLPYTSSPEYPGGTTRDCNYDLSLLRWGCTTLLQANDLLRANDELATKWRDVLQNLVDYPADKNGLRIGRDVAFAMSHRHFSHLLMIYPLHLVNGEQPGDRDLIENSLQHWYSMPAAMQGYSFTGGASIHAMMGRGNKARDCLNTLVTKFVKPNTMYLESGPVIETPLSAACGLQELYLQSWGDKIRVFPAMPDDWKEAAFDNLRTEGAFLVSAVRSDGKTRWVKIRATATGICVVKPGIEGPLKVKSKTPRNLKEEGNGVYAIDMKKGEELVLYANDSDLLQDLREVRIEKKENNPFGTKIKRSKK